MITEHPRNARFYSVAEGKFLPGSAAWLSMNVCTVHVLPPRVSMSLARIVDFQ